MERHPDCIAPEFIVDGRSFAANMHALLNYFN
jgi:hypothetical protein